jgi:hypothetical protein
MIHTAGRELLFHFIDLSVGSSVEWIYAIFHNNCYT